MGNFLSMIGSWVGGKEIRKEASGSSSLIIEESERSVEGRDGNSAVSDWYSGDVHLQELKVLDSPSGPSSSAASDLTVLKWTRTDDSEKFVDFVSANDAAERRIVDKELYESLRPWDLKLSSIDNEIRLVEQKISSLDLEDPTEEVKEDVAYEPFVPLTDAEENYVLNVLFGFDRQELLVAHESSNIEITRKVLQCLRPGYWLNDEVINLYLELLKEREKRNPQIFLKCHFFNTFFYKKLISGRNGYDYKAVRRWTNQKKIGYGLIECDKIFVPVHNDRHWCLAVININDAKFQYLDSLGGMDSQVLKVLASYFVDEVKDKSSKDVDVSFWKQEFVNDLPEQKNGCDCGMFMIKYVDFYSRGLTLCFNQVVDPNLFSADGHTQIFGVDVE